MAASSLPLHCSICPKQPKFSDVSHLLTHVASKSHLSHYYKTRLRSLTDPAAAIMLEAYNAWYVNSDIETLMSNRLCSKEIRRGRVKATSKPCSKPKVKMSKDVQPVDTTSSSKLIGIERRLLSVLDPQLESSFDESMFSLIEEDDTFRPYGHSELSTGAESKRPRLYLFQTNRPGSFRALSLQVEEAASAYALSLPESSTNSENASVVSENERRTRGSNDDSSRLKGVLWPGMAIFDAATPAMKRKRNQKKDTSVVEHLERRSLQVEATECVYTPQGSLKKSRPISGQVDPDSSPVVPAEKLSYNRAPLSEMSSNVFANQDHRPRLSVPKFNVQHVNATSNTRKPMRTGRGKSFHVHVDEEVFGNPRGMNVLNSGFQAPQNLSSHYEYGESVTDTTTTAESNDGPYFPQVLRVSQVADVDMANMYDTANDGMYQLLQQIYCWAEQDVDAHPAGSDDGTISDSSAF